MSVLANITRPADGSQPAVLSIAGADSSGGAGIQVRMQVIFHLRKIDTMIIHS